MSVHSNYDAIGAALEAQYPKRQLYHQKFKHDDWWEAFLPKETEYFGVKSLNIFIVQKPYGWKDTGGGTYEFSWTPIGMDEAFASRLRDQFTSYKTIVYIDIYTADRVKAECPATLMREMMEQTAGVFEVFCNATEGFQFGGRITTAVDASFFTAVVDNFFNPDGRIPEYLKPTA